MLLILMSMSMTFGNVELNRYLKDKDLTYQVIEDKKNKRVIVDLIDKENRIIIFTKYKSDYIKTFDNKLYFPISDSHMSTTTIEVVNNKICILHSVTNVENSINLSEYSCFENKASLNSKLLSIYQEYWNIESDTIDSAYFFLPTKEIPTLKNYTKKTFQYNYLDKNRESFIKCKVPKNTKAMTHPKILNNKCIF
jgi:hypothetical protein